MQGGLNAAVTKRDERPDLTTRAGRLKYARDHWGWTQMKLSELSGVKQSDISKLERNDSKASAGLPALARALQCDVDWLDTGEGEPDFGRVLRGWPFPDIDRARFTALTHDQRIEIQGIVRRQITDFEESKASTPRQQAGKVAVTAEEKRLADAAAPSGAPVKSDSTKVSKSPERRR